MEVRGIRDSETRAAFELLAANGWSHRLGSLPDFTALLEARAILEPVVRGFPAGPETADLRTARRLLEPPPFRES